MSARRHYTVPTRFAYRERVRITEPAAPALVGLHGVVRRYRTDGDTGATMYLVEIDGPTATLAHREQWFTEDALESLPPVTATPAPTTYRYPPFDVGDEVRVLPTASAGSRHTGAAGRIHKFRPSTSIGVVPVSIDLSGPCPCCTKGRGDHILVEASRLEPIHPATPSPLPAVGARVKILSLPGGPSMHVGARGEVVNVHTTSPLPAVDVRLTEPCPCGCFKPTGEIVNVWAHRTEPDTTPTPTPEPTRVLIRLDLAPGEPVPMNVTELIDALADHHLDVGWSVTGPDGEPL